MLVGVDVDFGIMAAIDVSMRSMERRMVDKRKAAELTPVARLVTCPVEETSCWTYQSRIHMAAVRLLTCGSKLACSVVAVEIVELCER